LLKINKEFYDDLNERVHCFDETHSKIEEMITDEYTKGYLICMLLNVWEGYALEEEELNETILRFIKNHLVE